MKCMSYLLYSNVRSLIFSKSLSHLIKLKWYLYLILLAMSIFFHLRSLFLLRIVNLKRWCLVSFDGWFRINDFFQLGLGLLSLLSLRYLDWWKESSLWDFLRKFLTCSTICSIFTLIIGSIFVANFPKVLLLLNITQLLIFMTILIIDYNWTLNTSR